MLSWEAPTDILKDGISPRPCAQLPRPLPRGPLMTAGQMWAMICGQSKKGAMRFSLKQEVCRLKEIMNTYGRRRMHGRPRCALPLNLSSKLLMHVPPVSRARPESMMSSTGLGGAGTDPSDCRQHTSRRCPAPASACTQGVEDIACRSAVAGDDRLGLRWSLQFRQSVPRGPTLTAEKFL